MQPPTVKRHAVGALLSRWLAIGLLVLTSLLTSAFQPAWAEPAALTPIEVSEHMTTRAVLPHALLLEDPSTTKTWSQLQDPRLNWQPQNQNILSLGYSHSAWWLHFRVHNPAHTPVLVIANLGTAVQDDMQWTLVNTRTGEVTHTRFGDRSPFSARDLPLRQFSQRIAVPAQTTVDAYLRLNSFDGLQDVVDLTLSDQMTFLDEASRRTAGLSLFLGLMLAAAIYTLLLARIEAVYAWLALHLFFFIGWYSGFHGFTAQYLLPNQPNIANDVMTTVTALAALSFVLFALAYLRPALRGWRWSVRMVQLLLLPLAAVPVMALMGYYGPAWLIILSSATPVMIGLIFIALRVAWQGAGFARRFLIGFTAALLSVTGTTLETLGLMPGWMTPPFSMELGLGFGYYYLLYSVSRHLRELRHLRREAETRERELAVQKDAQHRQMQLQSDNHILRQKTITDELTGVFNRRHFNDSSERMLLDSLALGRPLGLCMLDVDYFKRYNDHYGHQQGDVALRLIARTLQKGLAERNQTLFRLGGEEFGFFIDCETGAEALAMAQALGDRVRQLNQVHAASPMQRLTISLGVAWWPKHEVPELQRSAMYERADQALYVAKSRGRDTSVLDDGTLTRSGNTLRPGLTDDTHPPEELPSTCP